MRLKADRIMLNMTVENKLEFIKNDVTWKLKRPYEWDCTNYVEYLIQSGVADYYYDFFNCIDRHGTSYGFRAPSIDISRVWAIENKFLIHKCYKHKGEKHSELITDERYPTATWICPESGWKTQIPHRYNNIGSYIPITFDINNRENGIIEILNLGYKARIWHFEMSIFKNIFRGETIFPDHLKIHTQGDKWERVNAHNLIMEFDTKDERINGETRRKDIMDEGDRIIDNAQKIIGIVNNEMDKVGISTYEWWFSGGGIYFILHHMLNDDTKKSNRYTNLSWFNSELYKWDKYQGTKILKLLEGVKYIGLDYKKQFIRSYLKAPYSLHRRFDRVVLPLTGFFGGNDKIDLANGNWRYYIYPRNINKKFIKKINVDI